VALVDDVREALERAVPDFGDRRGDWAGVLAAAQADVRDRRREWSRWAVAVLAPVTVVGALALSALFVSSPWKNSPGFLERAQAALTPPAGSVLHYTWETKRTSTDFGCAVTQGPNEIWIDQTPPHRYRVLTSDLVDAREKAIDARTFACANYRTIEFGDARDGQGTLMLVHPDTLRLASGVYLNVPRDPVASLRETIREAIGNGRAHHEGKTELDGLVVERIRLDPESDCRLPLPCPPPRPSYAYVDPKTLAPVQVESPYGYTIGPGPVVRLDIVVRYLAVEYLPRTAATLALTDIRAQHPNATGP
jgi:hypothetical protein